MCVLGNVSEHCDTTALSSKVRLNCHHLPLLRTSSTVSMTTLPGSVSSVDDVMTPVRCNSFCLGTEESPASCQQRHDVVDFACGLEDSSLTLRSQRTPASFQFRLPPSHRARSPLSRSAGAVDDSATRSYAPQHPRRTQQVELLHNFLSCQTTDDQ